MPARTSWMPRQSKKRKELRKQVGPLEKEFLLQFTQCAYCVEKPATCIDHIAGGAIRGAALSHRFSWNPSCLPCNLGPANDPTVFPVIRKLAVKLVVDGEFFDLIAFNRLRGQADDAITIAEVSAFLEWR